MALSAPRFKKKRVIKATLETTKGTKIAATSAVRVFDLETKNTSPYEKRSGTGLYRGNTSKGGFGEHSGEISFKLELRGNGANGMDSGIAVLLQGCGLLKTLEVFQVHSSYTDDKTLSIDVWEDGKKKGLAGAMGNVNFEGEVGDSMIVTFEFKGIWVTPSDEALPAYAPGTQTPMKLKGGSFTLGGETIKIGKYSLNMNNVVTLRPDASVAGGILCAAISDSDPTVSIDPEDDLVAGYAFESIKAAGTEAAISLGLSDGTDTITFATAKVQTTELTPSDRDGIATYDFTGQCNSDVADDNAVVITAA